MEVTLVERAVYILDMNVERRSGSKLRLCDCIVLGGAAPSPTDRTNRVEYVEDADCRRNILNAVTILLTVHASCVDLVSSTVALLVQKLSFNFFSRIIRIAKPDPLVYRIL